MTIFVVLGMHKSGTTMVARCLEEAGVSMRDFPEEVNSEEAMYCERASVRAQNVELLGPSSTDSLKLGRVLGDGDWPSGCRSLKNATDLFGRLNLENAGHWGFKDPRAVLTYRAFWKKVLPNHEIIVVFRSPLEIIEHYTRGWKFYKRPWLVLRAYKALKVWLIYNSEILKIVEEESPRVFLVVNFSNIGVNLKETREISQRLGVAVDHVIRKPKRSYGRKYFILLALFSKVLWIRTGVRVGDVYKSLAALRAGMVDGEGGEGRR